MTISPVHRILILMAAFLLAATAFTISRARSAEGTKKEAAATPARAAPVPVHPVRRPARRAERRSAHTPARTSHVPAKPRRAARRPLASTSDEVVRAVTAGRVVVLLLYGRNGADDDAARAAVRELPRGNGTAVFEDEVDHLARYRRVVPASGIDRTPTILVIGRNRQMHSIEGYIDPGSLKQYVEDARR